MRSLKPRDFSSVREAVRKFEGATRGELVPLVVADAGDYAGIPHQTGLFGFALALVGGEIWSLVRDWPLDAREITALVVGGAVLGAALGMVPAVARRILGRERIAKNVHRRALAEFVRQGCGATREEIGILVMVALFERRIEIVADRGIQSTVAAKESPGVWDAVTAEFSRAARDGRAVEGLVAAIEKIGAILARHFPPDPNRANELPDELRTEDE